jgi:hypothetical protein
MMRRLLKINALLIMCSSHIIAQTLQFQIEHLLTIGGSNNLNEGHLFVYPQEAHTDSKGNIFIRDITSAMGQFSQSILKYDKEGLYQETIGRSGKGPGEFKRILCFCVNTDDDLIIYDADNFRYTKYSQSTKSFDTIILPKNFSFYTKSIRPFGNGYILMHAEASQEEDDSVFDVLTNNFSETSASFGPKKIFWDLKKPLLFHDAQYGTLNFAFLDTTTLLAVNDFYNGRLTLMTKINNHWNFETIKGKKPRYNSFKKDDRRPQTFTPEKYLGHIWFGFKKKSYGYQIFNRSLGIFSLPKKRTFIHFVSTYEGKNKVSVGFNLFSDNGEYQGYYEITKDPRTCKDIIGQEGDTFFIVGYDKNDAPIVQKIQINITE